MTESFGGTVGQLLTSRASDNAATWTSVGAVDSKLKIVAGNIAEPSVLNQGFNAYLPSIAPTPLNQSVEADLIITNTGKTALGI